MSIDMGNEIRIKVSEDREVMVASKFINFDKLLVQALTIAQALDTGTLNKLEIISSK